MKVILAEERTIEGVKCEELHLINKVYQATVKDSAGVDIPNGATAMTWRLVNKSAAFTTRKGLPVLGEDVADEDVKQKLIDAGWILEEDEVIL